MGAKNKIIAGEYEGRAIAIAGGKPYILFGFGKSNMKYINKDFVESYQLVTEEFCKSAASGIARGAVGVALLGPIGLLAGLSAKNKGVHTIVIKFKDGKESLAEVDEKIYKAIMATMF